MNTGNELQDRVKGTFSTAQNGAAPPDEQKSADKLDTSSKVDIVNISAQEIDFVIIPDDPAHNLPVF